MTSGTDTGVHEVFDLSSEFVDRMAALRPTMATYQGLAGHDGAWDDFSPEGGDAIQRFIAGYEQRLAALPKAEDRWAELAMKIMAEHLKLERTYYEDGDDMLDLNNIVAYYAYINRVATGLGLVSTIPAEHAFGAPAGTQPQAVPAFPVACRRAHGKVQPGLYKQMSQSHSRRHC